MFYKADSFMRYKGLLQNTNMHQTQVSYVIITKSQILKWTQTGSYILNWGQLNRKWGGVHLRYF